MNSILRLKSEEFNENLIKTVKRLFHNKEIEISIYEVDETDYLLKSPANKNRLLEAIKHVDSKKHLKQINIKELK